MPKRAELTVKDMRCSSKQAHESQRIAMIRGAEAERRGVKLYTYKCPVCKKWHLTKQVPSRPYHKQVPVSGLPVPTPEDRKP